MYEKRYNVTVKENGTRAEKITFFVGDGLSSVLRFHIIEDRKDYVIQDTDKFRLCLLPVPQNPIPLPQHLCDRVMPEVGEIKNPDRIPYIEQDDQDLVEVIADKKGYVDIKLTDEMLSLCGRNLPMNLVMYNDDGCENRFYPFFIDVVECISVD